MSEAFLKADIALFSSFKDIDGSNVIDFIELIVQSLNYRFTSSKFNGKRKTEAVLLSNAADKVLRHYIDARYKNENVDIAKIRAIVSSLEPSVRNNIELCSYVYTIQPEEVSNGLQEPVNGPRILLENYEALHPGRSLILLDLADQELADGIFDLSNVFPESIKRLVRDMRKSRANWSGIMLLDSIFREIDPYGTIRTLIETKLAEVQYRGPGYMSDFLNNKRKLFERLPRENQIRLNNGMELSQKLSSTFKVGGNELTKVETIEFCGFTESILVKILASPLSKTNVKKVCDELLSCSRNQIDFTRSFHKLVIADKLDDESTRTPSKELVVHTTTTKRKRFQSKVTCFNCNEKGHLYFQCQKPLRADLQRRVDNYKPRSYNQKFSQREKKKVKSTDSE